MGMIQPNPPPHYRKGFSWSLLTLVGIFVIALFMRVYHLDRVPPGIHADEVINGEIAQIAKTQGPRIFYAVAGGREGLYHLALAASTSLPIPVHWQMRLPSILSSLVGLIITFVWVRRTFGFWAAVTAAGSMAATFWAVGLGRAALRATMILPIAAAIIWLLLSLIGEDRHHEASAVRENGHSAQWLFWAKLVALALLIGLSVYTYRSARLVPLIVVFFLLYLFVWHRPVPGHLLLAFAGSLLICLPLAIFLIKNPGAEPRIAEVDRPWREMLDGNPGPVLKGVVVTIGMFGWQGDPESHYNLAGRPVFDPVGAFLFYAGLLLAISRIKKPRYALILIWLLVGLLPGIVTEPVPHFVHTVTAMPVAFVFPGLVVDAVAGKLQRRTGRQGQIGLAILLVIWMAASAYWTFNDYFTVWPSQEQVRRFHQSDVAEMARYLDESVEPLPVAVCTLFLNEQDPFWRSGRQSLPYLMNRSDVSVRWYHCGSSLVWPNGGQSARYAFLAETSPDEWMPSRWFQALNRASTTTLTSEDGSVAVRIFELDGSQELAALLTDLQPPEDLDLPVNLGNSLDFLGYQLTDNRFVPGETFTIDGYWRVTESLPSGLSVFVHLMSDPTTLLAQGDALNVMTHTVLPGDIFMQQHAITIPADARAGSYLLSVGIYYRDGRNPPFQVIVDGQTRGDRVLLQSIYID